MLFKLFGDSEWPGKRAEAPGGFSNLGLQGDTTRALAAAAAWAEGSRVVRTRWMDLSQFT